MSDTDESLPAVVERLGRHDPYLEAIYFSEQCLTDAEVAELVDCLLAHPNVVTDVYLDGNQLTDETGIKLARYLAASSTIQKLTLVHNQLGSATYLALAAALRVNSSLRILHLFENQAVDRTRIDAAFMEALRLNPVRPARSVWCLFAFCQQDVHRLKHAAEQLGHPSLQLLLAARLLTDDQLAATQL